MCVPFLVTLPWPLSLLGATRPVGHAHLPAVPSSKTDFAFVQTNQRFPHWALVAADNDVSFARGEWPLFLSRELETSSPTHPKESETPALHRHTGGLA